MEAAEQAAAERPGDVMALLCPSDAAAYDVTRTCGHAEVGGGLAPCGLTM